jgi:hypothetical protein
MTDTTLEEAKRCPACQEPGILLNRRPAPKSAHMPQGTMVELYECRNDRCPDYLPPTIVGMSTIAPGSRYRFAIQVNPDGTVPPKGTGASSPKNYELPGVHTNVAQQARDQLRLMAASDERGGNSQEATEIARDLGYPR